MCCKKYIYFLDGLHVEEMEFRVLYNFIAKRFARSLGFERQEKKCFLLQNLKKKWKSVSEKLSPTMYLEVHGGRSNVTVTSLFESNTFDVEYKYM